MVEDVHTIRSTSPRFSFGSRPRFGGEFTTEPGSIWLIMIIYRSMQAWRTCTVSVVTVWSAKTSLVNAIQL